MGRLALLTVCYLLVAAGGCYRSHPAMVARPAIVSAAEWESQPEAVGAEQRHVRVWVPEMIVGREAEIRVTESSGEIDAAVSGDGTDP